MSKHYILLVFITLSFYSCKYGVEEGYVWNKLKVTATAYNSLAYQTSSDPHITAWGDSLTPGKNYIAVSRDLIDMGITHNTPVYIDGFDNVFWGKDKMHWRWKKRIDIYMGTSVKKARQWGKKKVRSEERRVGKERRTRWAP